MSATGSVTITIQGANDAPVANDDTASTTEDASVSGNVLANDTDVDDPDTKTVSDVNGSGANVGSLTCNVAGGVGFVFGSSRTLGCLWVNVVEVPEHLLDRGVEDDVDHAPARRECRT